ncbi:hypothetical protein Q8F55_001427 [Vanrija albida]|uniref:Uncharacterized protein n=1 Tax=Vanrija albida TaxID=181172 RepID=A0ABR3QG19_9TREE
MPPLHARECDHDPDGQLRFDRFMPCPAPVYRAAPWGNPINLHQHRAAWTALVDDWLVPYTSTMAIGDRAIDWALDHDYDEFIAAIQDYREVIIDMVRSAARLLLVYIEGKLRFNSLLAGALWGHAGYEMCANLTSLFADTDLDDLDPSLEPLRLHRLAEYLHNHGWPVPGLTPEILASLDAADKTPGE